LSTDLQQTTTGKYLLSGLFNYRDSLESLGRVVLQGINVTISALQKRQNVRLSAHRSVMNSAQAMRA
jgi:hypothetical protein